MGECSAGGGDEYQLLSTCLLPARHCAVIYLHQVQFLTAALRGTSQVGSLRLKEVKRLAQGHRAGKWESQLPIYSRIRLGCIVSALSCSRVVGGPRICSLGVTGGPVAMAVSGLERGTVLWVRVQVCFKVHQ